MLHRPCGVNKTRFAFLIFFKQRKKMMNLFYWEWNWLLGKQTKHSAFYLNDLSKQLVLKEMGFPWKGKKKK